MTAKWIWDVGLGALIATGVVAIGYFGFSLMIEGGDPGDKVHALCDKEVEALLNSKDLVEVQRAGFLVRWMDCNVSRRLP